MTWNDVSFNQYLDIIHYYENSSQYGDDLDKIISLLVIFDNELDIEEMYNKKYLEVQEMFEPIGRLLSTEIEYDSLPYEPFIEMSYGDWINLDEYLKDRDWNGIFNTIFRKKEYNLDLDSISPVKIFDAYLKFLDYRKETFENYSFAFNLDPVVENDEETPEERLEREEIMKDQQQNAQFTWYLHTYDVAKGDITKFDEIFEMNHLFIFNIIDMKKRFKLNEVYRGI
ncbi:hypothetical protein UFOVP182_8 [uncultured Caudovirales phage]|uniref:Uncharacterized protein n=1 Tax=uncultured Caudovirales phage TaxID=2100421 RepID=A0A6J7WCY2_9CAUD|nr:hypothetical protein UFOVP182_8 [uncultured Caudovirales phage]